MAFRFPHFAIDLAQHVLRHATRHFHARAVAARKVHDVDEGTDAPAAVPTPKGLR